MDSKTEGIDTGEEEGELVSSEEEEDASSRDRGRDRMDNDRDAVSEEGDWLGDEEGY